MVPAFILESGGAASLKDVRQFERDHGVTLPQSLRKHLTINGCRPQPGWVRCIESDYFPDGLCYVDELSGFPLYVESIHRGRQTRSFVSIAGSGDNSIWLEVTGGLDGPVFYQLDTSGSLASNIRDNKLVQIHDSYESFISSFEYHPQSLPWLPWIHNRDYSALAEWIDSTRNINVKNESGLTPLEEAACLGDETAVEMLAKKSKLGNAADCALQGGHRGLARRLKRGLKGFTAKPPSRRRGSSVGGGTTKSDRGKANKTSGAGPAIPPGEPRPPVHSDPGHRARLARTMVPSIVESGGMTPPKRILQFEQETSVTLPPSLKRRLMMVNGGTPRPCWVLCDESAFFPDGLCYVDRLLGLPVKAVSGSLPVIRIESLRKGKGNTHYILFATSGERGIWLETSDGSEGPVYCQMDARASLADAMRDGRLVRIHDSYESFLFSFTYHPKSLPWLPLIHKRDYRALIKWIDTTKNINVKNEFDMTPLEAAASLGDMAAVQFLLAGKAKLERAAEVALRFGHQGLATTLKRAPK
jgi:hypothetical protein